MLSTTISRTFRFPKKGTSRIPLTFVLLISHPAEGRQTIGLWKKFSFSRKAVLLYPRNSDTSFPPAPI